MAEQTHYVANSEIGFDEDDMHEFKSHRTICVEETPQWCVLQEGQKLKRSRQPVSKTICAFLNTAKGGTVYLGILNDGRVVGTKLEQYQRDHVIIAVHDVLTRFQPPVPPEQVKIDFKPVFDGGHSAETIKKLLETYDKEKDSNKEARFKRDHVIRSQQYCWCDKDALARYNMGTLTTSFVIEITVLPWSGHAALSTKAPLYPFYQNEEGLCYIRRSASNVMLTLQEVYDFTQNQVRNFYQPTLHKLEEEAKILRAKAKVVLEKRKKEKEAEAAKLSESLAGAAIKGENEETATGGDPRTTGPGIEINEK